MAGGLLTFFLYNGLTVSSVRGTFTLISFDFVVTSDLLIPGIGPALSPGSVRGAVPAYRAVQKTVIDGLEGR